MKKTVCILLLCVLVFNLVACDFLIVEDVSTGSGQQAGTTPSTPEAPSTPQTPSTPTNKPSASDDTIVYTPTTNEDGTLVYANEALQAPKPTPYYHGYKAALSMTFDDGGHYQTGYNVSEVFAKYGFTGTEMMTASFVNSDHIISEWNKILALGYMDVGCHGYNHADPNSLSSSQYEHEIKEAIMFLREKFPTQNVLTYATPLAQSCTPYEEYMADYVIANRLEAQGTQVYLGNSFNYYRIKAVSVNERSAPPALKGIQTYINTGAWVVELYHEIREDASGINYNKNSFEAHCKMLYDNFKDELWVASFEKVAIYAKQLEGAYIEYTGSTNSTMTFRAGTTIANDIYNIPMSFVVYIPNIADSAYAVVNGEKQYLDVSVDDYGKKYVTVRDVPANGGEFTIHLGGNYKCENGCKHIFTVLETHKPTCFEFGYNLNGCLRCDKTYIGKYTDVLAHRYFRNPIDYECPTEEKDGYMTFECEYCGSTKTEIVEWVPPDEEETE